MAMVSEVIAQPGFDYAEEDSYHQYAAQLRDASVALTQAVDVGSFESAAQAIGNMEKACSNCHDEWR